MMYVQQDINFFAFLLLQQIYVVHTYEEINYLFDVYTRHIFPPDWDMILSQALWEQRIEINQEVFVQRLREAGGL